MHLIVAKYGMTPWPELFADECSACGMRTGLFPAQFFVEPWQACDVCVQLFHNTKVLSNAVRNLRQSNGERKRTQLVFWRP